MQDIFAELLLQAATIACQEWDLPPDDLRSWVVDPPQSELRAALSRGLREGSFVIVGTSFRLPDLPPTKVPTRSSADISLA